jgi:hypothetical protein
MKRPIVSPPRFTLETGGTPRALPLPEAHPTGEVSNGVEEQRAAPTGYRRFTVSDHEGALIMDTLIRSCSIHPGFISGLHQLLAEENPGPRLTL